MDDCAGLEEILTIAQRVLIELEKKAAGYTSLTIPSNLKIELEDKRKEVEDLKTRLAEAQSSKKEAQSSSQEEEIKIQSPMRSQVPNEYYIEREEAKRLLKRFADALKQPQKNALVFNIYGIGGVGKTTLLGRLKEANAEKVDFLEVCFAKTSGIESPLKLMRKLHQQIMNLVATETSSDSFTQKEKQFEDAIFQLSKQSPNGEGEEARKITSWFERFIWLGLTSLTAISRKPEASGSGFYTLEAIGNDAEGLREWIEQRVRNHPAIKDQPKLQELMLEPVPKLTQAFAESLMKIAQSRGRSLVVVLDTYEKAQPYLNQWLWQYLIEDTPLSSASIRFVVVGRRSLQADEGWRKLNQDRRLLDEVQLQKFSKNDTVEYLKKIGIDNGRQLANIFKTTQGLPYYLDWVRTQHEQGKKLDFSQGNQAIAELLLQGIDSQQRKILQVIACCRWFDEAILQYLLEDESLSLKQSSTNVDSFFEWLKHSDFVEFSQGHHRLDDVVRDVFRQSYFQDNRNQFRKTNGLLADYFKQQADELYDSQSLLPDRYEDEEWRELSAEFLYYSLFGKGKDGLRKYIEQVFAAAYLREPDVFTAPFGFINAEINQENKDLLPKATNKFFKNSGLVLNFGWLFLDKLPNSYKLQFEGENTPSKEEVEKFPKQIEASIQSLLEFVGDLENGFGKFVGLLYKSLRCNSFKERNDLLLQAKRQTEEIIPCCCSKLEHRLLSQLGNAWNNHGAALGNLKRHEEALESLQTAIELNPQSDHAWSHYGAALVNLERYEEALESSQKAIKLNPQSDLAWSNYGAALGNLKRYEEALESFQTAIELNPQSDLAWSNYGAALGNLKRYEKALESFQTAIELNPQSDRAWTSHSLTLINLGRYEEALESSQKAIKLNPQSDLAWTSHSFTLNNLERYEEALESSQKAIKLNPQSDLAWTKYSDVLTHLRRYEEAFSACKRALGINPQEPEPLNSQALTLSFLKQFDQAITAIDRAIKLDPQEVLCRANRGIILARAGRYKDALADCEQAIKQDPKHESGYYGRACCYALKGEIDPVIDNLKKAIDITPRFSRREAKNNPDFDIIRNDERFQALVYLESTS